MDTPLAAHAQDLSLVHEGGRIALDAISFSVRAGERVAIIGPSGAGKTTLLQLCTTALRQSSGTLALLGEDPWALGAGARRRLRRRIGLIHQSPPLPPRQRVVTAVLAGRLGAWSLSRALASLAYPADVEGARAALARVDLSDRVYDRCDRLSGGQAQRVGIARVLYQQPELILADEPVSALDPALSNYTVSVLVDEARVRNVTLIASLHAVDLALAHFPRVIGLRDGRVAFDLPTAAVDEARLESLYAQEGVLPVQGRELTLPRVRTPRAVRCN
ncbi:MAG: phosphonate ABC transporter [Betaproteobacteria bacterium SG8_39]|nr:MAG: phosphonate ABC transporter [Betaproteobacteria bacterium SG8_39]